MTEEPGRSPARLHASAVVVDEAGILIRGATGSGKSTLARTLVTLAGREGRFARLIGDDVVTVEAMGGRLVVAGSPAITGLAEVRGAGIVRLPSAAAAVVRLVVECGAEASRLPRPDESRCTLAGITCRRLALGEKPDPAFVLWWLGNAHDAIMTVS